MYVRDCPHVAHVGTDGVGGGAGLAAGEAGGGLGWASGGYGG